MTEFLRILREYLKEENKVSQCTSNEDSPKLEVKSETQFIPYEGIHKRIGECIQSIGEVLLVGYSIGCISGLYHGNSQAKQSNLTGKSRRMCLFHFARKHGRLTRNASGIVILMFGGFSIIYSEIYSRHCVLDGSEYNSLILAGTSTGLFYRATAGWRKCTVGGAIGFGVSTALFK